MLCNGCDSCAWTCLSPPSCVNQSLTTAITGNWWIAFRQLTTISTRNCSLRAEEKLGFCLEQQNQSSNISFMHHTIIRNRSVKRHTVELDTKRSLSLSLSVSLCLLSLCLSLFFYCSFVCLFLLSSFIAAEKRFWKKNKERKGKKRKVKVKFLLISIKPIHRPPDADIFLLTKFPNIFVSFTRNMQDKKVCQKHTTWHDKLQHVPDVHWSEIWYTKGTDANTKDGVIRKIGRDY